MTEQLHRIEWTEPEKHHSDQFTENELVGVTSANPHTDTPFLRAARAYLDQLNAEAAKTVQGQVLSILNEVHDDTPGCNAEIVATFVSLGLLAPDEPPKLLIDYLIDYLNENGWTNYQITRLAAVPLCSMDHLCRAAVVEAEAAGRDLS